MSKSSKSPALERVFHAGRSGVNSIDFSPDTSQLASGGDDGSLMIWNFEPRKRAYKYVDHKDGISSVCFSPCGQLVASGSVDKTIRIHVPDNSGKSESLSADNGPIRSVHFSHDSKYLVSAGDYKVVKVWDIDFRRSFCSITHTSVIRSCQFSPDSSLIATGCDDKTVKVFDAKSKECVFKPSMMQGSVKCVQFHPTMNVVAASDSYRAVKLWDLRMQKLLQLYKVHRDSVNCLAYDPSGEFLISGSNDSEMKIMHLDEGRLIYTVVGHNGPVRSVCFSKQGDYFATAACDSRVMVWKSNLDTFSKCDIEKVIEAQPTSETISVYSSKTDFSAENKNASVHGKAENENQNDESVTILKSDFEELLHRYSNVTDELESVKQRLLKLEQFAADYHCPVCSH